MLMLIDSALILLHRPYMMPSSPTKSKLFESIPSLNICISAANSITHLSEHLMDDDVLRYVWCFTIYGIFQSSLIHLTNSASLDVRLQAQARKNLIKMIAYLKNLGIRWFNAAKFSAILEDLMCMHLNLDDYKMDTTLPGKQGEGMVGDYLLPIVLRDQHHPSGGTLLFAPKVIAGTHTPSSTTTTPSSSPSTSLIHNPSELQEVKQEPPGQDLGTLQNIQHSYGNGDANFGATVSANHALGKKKSRKGTGRNSLLFQTTTNSSSSSSSSPASSSPASSLADAPFTFSSLSTPGVFAQGQAFMDYGQMMAMQQQLSQQLQSQSSQNLPVFSRPQQPQPQPQQQPPPQPVLSMQQQQQQQQPAQIFTLTPLFSSSLALQERCVQQQQQMPSSANDAPKDPMSPIQQQQQFLRQQQELLQHQFIQQQQQHEVNMCLQGQQQQLNNSQNGLSNIGFAGETPGQDGGSLGTPSNAATPAMSSSNLPGSEDYSNISLFPSQEPAQGQGPNLMAVPNPFYGIPNTIDWDEWNHYIANAGLQKF